MITKRQHAISRALNWFSSSKHLATMFAFVILLIGVGMINSPQAFADKYSSWQGPCGYKYPPNPFYANKCGDTQPRNTTDWGSCRSGYARIRNSDRDSHLVGAYWVCEPTKTTCTLLGLDREKKDPGAGPAFYQCTVKSKDKGSGGSNDGGFKWTKTKCDELKRVWSSNTCKKKCKDPSKYRLVEHTDFDKCEKKSSKKNDDKKDDAKKDKSDDKKDSSAPKNDSSDENSSSNSSVDPFTGTMTTARCRELNRKVLAGGCASRDDGKIIVAAPECVDPKEGYAKFTYIPDEDGDYCGYW